MTERLYYADPYATQMKARTIEHIRVDGRLGLVLNKTIFYPTAGGQPCDRGAINHVPVIDVFVRESDQAVVHVLADEIWANSIEGEIDWPRRFDHMQQHTGQHILSAVLENDYEIETIGFHIGADASTIDLNTDSLSAGDLAKIEKQVNQIIVQNRLVRSTIHPPSQVAQLPLRKLPQVEGPVRIVEIDQLDLSPCGGTHVSRTGEIGLFIITKVENRSRGLRLEFLCGGRALADYQAKHHMVTRLAADLTVGHWELGEAVARLRDEVKTMRSELRQIGSQLLDYKAKDMLHHAEFAGNMAIIDRVFKEQDRQEMNWLARALTDNPGVVVLFGLAGPKSHILFARSKDVDRDMVLLLKTALRVLGSTAGGGRPEMAQGGGPSADPKRVSQAIDRAKRLLLAHKS